MYKITEYYYNYITLYYTITLLLNLHFIPSHCPCGLTYQALPLFRLELLLGGERAAVLVQIHGVVDQHRARQEVRGWLEVEE